MKGKLEIPNNLTCYHININKSIVIDQAKKNYLLYPEPSLKLADFSNFSKTYLQSKTDTDNWAPKVRNVYFFLQIITKSILLKHNDSKNVH